MKMNKMVQSRLNFSDLVDAPVAMNREWGKKHTRNKDLFFSQEKQESLCVMLRKFKFWKIGYFEKQRGEVQGPVGGIMTECNSEAPVEHVLSLENAPKQNSNKRKERNVASFFPPMMMVPSYASFLADTIFTVPALQSCCNYGECSVSGSAKRLVKGALQEATKKREMRYSDVKKMDCRICRSF
ncbi:hypothetical protein C5167_013929 [Papaver somniferum]|uniref:Uncharacterized protein n=1 Tax=Papaver somniferum TaxID=3469 RepID=A0A4Y7J1R6_PAPSO|nr:hypothetical protein C5167_013929 [Papaver somniferum]